MRPLTSFIITIPSPYKSHVTKFTLIKKVTHKVILCLSIQSGKNHKAHSLLWHGETMYAAGIDAMGKMPPSTTHQDPLQREQSSPHVPSSICVHMNTAVTGTWYDNTTQKKKSTSNNNKIKSNIQEVISQMLEIGCTTKTG